MKIGILFGGPSREREISFAGGRTVYDNLDKSLFEAIPIFIDSKLNFIRLDWPFIYKGSIRDFYPPVSHLPDSPNKFQIYSESLGEIGPKRQRDLIDQVGKPVPVEELSSLIDFAFLSLHGAYGEDGQLQGILDSLGIPYSGSNQRASSIGMDKAFQKKLMESAGFPCPPVFVIHREEWSDEPSIQIELFSKAKEKTGFPIVIRPANQGSSIGVRIIKKNDGIDGFVQAINGAFFRQVLNRTEYQQLSPVERISFLREITDLRDGLGFPMKVKNKTIYHPEELLTYLDKHFYNSDENVILESFHSENKAIAEGFIDGKEFSCIVIKTEDGKSLALPPTEIVKGKEIFDYRSKYLAGLSRKETPIRLKDELIEKIRQECERLFKFFEFNTYARIDGFLANDGTIFLNDPNTTSGMLPSSFFFHQAAEIGLNPSQFLTYIIRTSLWERMMDATLRRPLKAMLENLDVKISALHETSKVKRRIAVVLGGYSSERHISVESGRNVYEKLASSDKYEPFPVFLLGNEQQFELYRIPVNLLLKDNADDIRDKILHFKKHPVVEKIKGLGKGITSKYGFSEVLFEPIRLSLENLQKQCDGVFLALHGRPGEDGTLQIELDKLGIPYNGSPPDSAMLTIDKFRTLQTLKEQGFTVTDQKLIFRNAYLKNPEGTLDEIEKSFSYPLIAKPLDDGCSAAVKLVKKRLVLRSFFEAMFRSEPELSPEKRVKLGLLPKEEFPQKETVLIEALIQPEGARLFMEITGGLLTHSKNGGLEYEIFEPSEALASKGILSLEEKFLAGEGQNITPARFSDNPDEYAYIARIVKKDLEKAARILNVRGYARIDAFVRIFEDGKVETIIIEVNSLPGMTPATCIFHQSAINNYKPYAFIDQILEFGFHEKGISAS